VGAKLPLPPGVVTVKVSLAVALSGASTLLTAPLVFRCAPTVELVTSTVTVQLLLAATVPPVKLTLPPPGTAVTVPPQLLVTLGVVALLISVG
jgi:hypothetical protein